MVNDYCLRMPEGKLRAYLIPVIKELESMGGWTISAPLISYQHQCLQVLQKGDTWSTFYYSFNVANLDEESILFLTLKYGITAEQIIYENSK